MIGLLALEIDVTRDFDSCMKVDCIYVSPDSELDMKSSKDIACYDENEGCTCEIGKEKGLSNC